MADLGLDSLMGVEIKQMLERDYDMNLSTREIRQLTIAKIQEISGCTQSAAQTHQTAASQLITRYNLNSIIPQHNITPLNSAKTGQPIFIVHPLEGQLKFQILPNALLAFKIQFCKVDFQLTWKLYNFQVKLCLNFSFNNT